MTKTSTTNIELTFDDNTTQDPAVESSVRAFLKSVSTVELLKQSPIIIYQDGPSKGYYIKCSIAAKSVHTLIDTDARLNPADENSFRANRVLLLQHNTYKRMLEDAKLGREFNDIIAEYNKEYTPSQPLKIWGGQHRINAIMDAYKQAQVSRYHGFRIFFNLTMEQRTEVALISNTNIDVSNDLFDRLQEETRVGLGLRKWCYQVGLLKNSEDFPDQFSRSENISVKLARTFVTNYFLGKTRSMATTSNELDKNVYEPYLCESGLDLDEQYASILKKEGNEVWLDTGLLAAGKAFAILHQAQSNAVRNSAKIRNRKSFRNKAYTESVISAWAFVAGLLAANQDRLSAHLSVPKTSAAIPDPLNAEEMSTFRHESDDPGYRGLGTRSSVKDRQRMAQLFLARSLVAKSVIDKNLMKKAVSTVVGLNTLAKGY